MTDKVLILCTGNSCRSIIGEALVTQLSNQRLQGISAGSCPTGKVNPHAIAVLAKKGLAVDNFRSKSWDEFTGQSFRFVITVCDQANQEVCPVFTGAYERLHWSIPDPAYATGEEVDAAFESAYELIKSKIESELLPRMS